MNESVSISVIVPVGQRRDPSGELLKEYVDALEEMRRPYELICVLDGQFSDTETQVEALIESSKYPVRLVQLAKTFGEATAIAAGLEVSTGEVIVTLPAYYQIEPGEIHRIVDALDTSDVTTAVRSNRTTATKFDAIRRRAFHWLVKFVTGDSFQDLGCGARAFKRAAISELPIYGDQHLFLPLLAAQRGYRVAEIPVPQSPKDVYGETYVSRTYIRRLLDIFTIFFLVRFTKKPLRFFGTIGSAAFIAGSVFLVFIVAERLFFDVALADRPALLLSSLLVVLGLQIFALGLLGELIIFTHARDIKEYTIDRIVN